MVIPSSPSPRSSLDCTQDVNAAARGTEQRPTCNGRRLVQRHRSAPVYRWCPPRSSALDPDPSAPTCRATLWSGTDISYVSSLLPSPRHLPRRCPPSSTHKYYDVSSACHLISLYTFFAGCSGLAGTCLAVVWEDRGSNPTVGSCMFIVKTTTIFSLGHGLNNRSLNAVPRCKQARQ